jgi:uncharacterized repeat protein (TIGR01451 family)
MRSCKFLSEVQGASMTRIPRLAGLMLTGILALEMSVGVGFSEEPKRTLPVRPAQFIQQPLPRQSPEPPLADQGRGTMVPAPQPRLVTPPVAVPAPLPEVYHEDPPTPVVAIRVRVPASAAAGQDLEYHICVENLSAAPAHHVIVRDPLPANTRYIRANPEPSAKEPELIWNLGTLEACACKEITLVLSPTGGGDVVNCARVQFEHGQCVTTRIARPGVKVTKSGPTQAAVNATLGYQLNVTNTGAMELTGVVLSDKLPVGLDHASGQRDLTWDLGTLAPGQSRVVDYQVVARAAGTFRNKAVVTAAGGLRDEVEHEVQVAEAKIGLTMTGPATANINAPVTYQITVSNGGTIPLTNVVLVDPVPAQMLFVSAGSGGLLMSQGGPAGTGVVQWNLGTLLPAASRTVEVVLRSSAPGRICNRARATADGGLSAQDEKCTDFEGQPGLLLMVVDTVDPVIVGGQTSYKITVLNQGFVRATNVRIQAEIPQELTFVNSEGPTKPRLEGQILTFPPIDLEPRKDARYEVFVQANKPGNLRFKVDMTADQLPSGKVHREEATTVFSESKNGQAAPQKRSIDER